MTTVSYYPGCSLEGTAKDYSESIHAVCRGLDINLAELADWNCCGATAAHSIDHNASVALAARNLAIAGNAGRELVAPCPLCYNRLKNAEKAQRSAAGTKVWDLANFLAQENMLDLIRSKVAKPLTGLKAVCYYGCMSSRPPAVTGAENCENPESLDNILKALGVEVIDWPYKTDCCGASHAIARPELVFELVGRLYKMAELAGANCIAVSCQMCQANLDMYQKKISERNRAYYYLPIFYFTELIGLSMSHPAAPTWLSRHFVDPGNLLAKVGLNA